MIASTIVEGVPSDGDTFGISHFQTDKEGHRFDRIIPSINIITQEEIVRVGDITTDGEEFDQVMELAMNITTDGDRCSDWLGITFIHENICCFFCDELYIFLGDRFEGF